MTMSNYYAVHPWKHRLPARRPVDKDLFMKSKSRVTSAGILSFLENEILKNIIKFSYQVHVI